jgi:beta-glucosidase
MPTLGAKNGIKLVELIGADYNDPKWQQLLDQLTFDEMVAMIGDSFHWRMPAESVNAPGSRDENGPQGLTVALFGSSLGVETTAFTSEDVMAATFNTELLYRVGNIIGNDCLAAEVACLYGPGANMHRMPYGGRNFEYYSEDGFLSGEICAAEVKGIQDKGVDVVIKHFALNDSEQDRIGLGVWLNEQAAREIYLKAYQAAFEESGANGVMTAYTRWGAVWSGGVKGLMTNILRKEWGNNGMSITDNVITPMVTGADGVLAGTTTYDAMLPNINNELPGYENDPVIVSAMREACHHNLYALVNSSAMNGITANSVIIAHELPLVKNVKTFSLVTGIAFVVFTALWIWGTTKLKKTEAYAAYKEMKKQKKAK